MKILKSINEYRLLRSSWFKQKLKIGFVPTMGALHNGHASLAALAKKECDIVVASIFVNPSQFAPNEDLSTYPRTLEDDVRLLNAVKTDYILLPSTEDMYPAGVSQDANQQVGTFVSVHGKSHQMEGQIRPHHFRGVATIVTKLFNIIQPTKAYFGQKDVQQCSVVKTMVRDLHFPVDIIIGETIRESDGLAMSSRNRRLSPEDRILAPVLYKGFRVAQENFEIHNMRDRLVLFGLIKAEIEMISSVKLEYLSLADPLSLQEVTEIGENGAILSGAIKMKGGTRIIDNILLGMDKSNL